MTTALRPRLSEAQWQVQFCDLAERLGWTWVHFPTVTTAYTTRGGALRHVHQTPYVGPLGKGWVDLVLMRERTIFVELKQDGRYPTREQGAMHEVARAAGCEVHVFKPRDFEEAQAVLARRLTPSTHSGPAACVRPGPGSRR